MKKTLALTITLFSFLFLNGQTPDLVWQKLIGGSLYEQATAIQQTSDGGYIIAASSDSQDGDVGSTNGDYDYWVIKLDMEGKVVWKYTYGGSDWDLPHSIKPTSEGGFIIIGDTYSDDVDVTGMNGFRDAWIIKLNSSGTLQWQKALGGSGADAGADVIENKDGYLVLGYDGGTNDGDLQGMGCNNDFWVIQLDFNGTILWQECYGGSKVDVPKKIVSAGENYLIVGETNSNDGDVTGHQGYADFWVIQINASGDLMWQKALGGSQEDIATDACFSSGTDAQFIITGTTYSNDGDVSFNHGGLDYWMVTLDANQNIINEKTYGGSSDDEAHAILPLSNNNFIVSGVTQSSDGDVSGFNGGADAWVVRVDISGNLIWNKSIGGSRGDVANACIGATNDDGILLVGRTNSSELSGYQGNDDLWIVKLGKTSTAVESVFTSEDALKIYPNPGTVMNNFYIESSLSEVERLFVRNISGQPVLKKEVQQKAEFIELSIPNHLQGTYILELHSPLGIQIGKLVVL